MSCAALVERAAALDRERVRADAVSRFSASRMIDDYESAYQQADRMLAPQQLTGSLVSGRSGGGR